jgi:15-hydroxyprostaglandin dehydrogenase (NAD)
MSIILEAFDKFIDENITGQVAEATSLGIVLRKPVEFANESARFLNEDMHDESKFSNFYEGGESAEARNS